MADIFLSYADEDRARAVRVVETLRGLGWTVWWSGDLPIGTAYRQEIQRQLHAAKCTLVLWSNTSVESEWVIDEAEEAKKRNILVQALLDPVSPPHGFRGRQWADLSNWRGDTDATEFVSLANGVRQLIAQSSNPMNLPTSNAPSPLMVRSKATALKFGGMHSAGVLVSLAAAIAVIALITGLVVWLRGNDRLAEDTRRNEQLAENMRRRFEVKFSSNRQGSDYKDFDLPEERWELCAKACDDESMCTAFTVTPRGHEGPNARCWLKVGTPPESPVPGFVSGVKFR